MRYGLMLLLFIGAILWMESTARAQRRQFVITGVTAEIDRGVVQAMIDAQRAIKQQQFVPAVTSFQSILDHPEDYFLRRDFSEKNVACPGVKAQTHRILAELPSEGQAAYELQFGATARARLAEALSSDHLDRVADIARRYQMTAAGLEAMQQLAASSIDHDELVEAALIYEAMTDHPACNKEQNILLLLRAAYVWHLAGQTERSVSILETLRTRHVPSPWQIGGQKLPPYREAGEAPGWLVTHFGSPVAQSVRTAKNWELPRGGSSGNESASVAYPAGGTAWTISPLKYSKFVQEAESNQNSQGSFEQLVRQVERGLRDNNRLIQPAAIPLVVGDTVVYRTLNDVTAINLQTGGLQWRSSVDDGMLSWMFQVPVVESDRSIASSPTSMPGYLRHKLFRDQLSGSLTSDGQNVYAIEGSDSQFLPLRPRARQRFGGPFITAPTNKLVAYDLKSGRISWEVGGLSGTPPVELSGLFFLGPPLPCAGRLYCLAEVKDELYLISLIPEANSARLEFSQTLIALNPIDWIGWPRRHAGLIPALSDQILICPSANGSIVAYDLLFRQLRWGYSYDVLKNRNDDDDRQLGIPFQGISLQNDEEEGRWIDGGPVISNGRVIVTPRDSGEIHCLNLVDGSLAWKRPRGVGLFVACVHNETVFIVGRSRIFGYSLKDGSETLFEPIEIPEPSGRGVRVGSKYLLPLSTGEVASFDLSNVRMLGRSKLPEGHHPGNLAIGHGTLVSCGIHDVIGFQTLQQIEQKIGDLVTTPDNPESLALRGEVRLHLGEQAEALSDLRASLAISSNPQVKRILAATLLNIVKQDSEQILNLAEEMDLLTDDPRQKIEFLRLYAESLNEAGNHAGAIKQLFRLADISSAEEEMVTRSPGYYLSVEQSIRSQLLTIFETSNLDERIGIEQEFQRELEEASASGDKVQKIARFVKLVSGHPAAESLLLKLADSREDPLNDLARFRILERLSFSINQTIAGSAVARLAQRSLALNLPRDARPWIEELGQKYATQICLDGQTGQQLSEMWSAREDILEARKPMTTWPAGPIDFERSNGILSHIFLPAEIVTHQGSHFVGWGFEIDPARGILSARDDSFRVVWQMPFANAQEVTRGLPCQLHIRGHRLAFSFGNWLVVMESSDSYSPPKVLFEKLQRSSSPMDWRPNEFRIERRLLPTGRRVPFDGRNPTGFLIGMSDDAVFYQLDNRLFSYDIETGRVAWTRIGPQFAKSDATVDRLLIMHTESNDAILLRPLDGKLLQQHKGSRAEKSISYSGTRRLRRLDGTGTDQQILEMRDFDGDKSVWKIQHPAGSLNWNIDKDELAVLEPSGKLSVVALETGQTRIVAQLPVVRPYGSGGVMAVQRYGQRYLIVAGSASSRTESKSVLTLSSETSFTLDGHVIAVDRQTGEIAWSVPVEHQAFDYSQPANFPILVLASQHVKIDRLGRREMTRLSAMILDKQTGRILYSTQETLFQNGLAARFIPIIEEGKLIVDFQTWNLVFTFPKPDSKPEK